MSLLPLLILAVLPSAPAAGDYPGATTVFHCTFDRRVGRELRRLAGRLDAADRAGLSALCPHPDQR